MSIEGEHERYTEPQWDSGWGMYHRYDYGSDSWEFAFGDAPDVWMSQQAAEDILNPKLKEVEAIESVHDQFHKSVEEVINLLVAEGHGAEQLSAEEITAIVAQAVGEVAG